MKNTVMNLSKVLHKKCASILFRRGFYTSRLILPCIEVSANQLSAVGFEHIQSIGGTTMCIARNVKIRSLGTADVILEFDQKYSRQIHSIALIPSRNNDVISREEWYQRLQKILKAGRDDIDFENNIRILGNNYWTTQAFMRLIALDKADAQRFLRPKVISYLSDEYHMFNECENTSDAKPYGAVISLWSRTTVMF